MEIACHRYGHGLGVIVGVALFFLSCFLWVMSLYLLPYLLWNWSYMIPSWINQFNQWFYDHYLLDYHTAHGIVLFICFMLGLFSSTASYLISTWLDRHKEPDQNTTMIPLSWTETLKDCLWFALKLIFWIILIVITTQTFSRLLY